MMWALLPRHDLSGISTDWGAQQWHPIEQSFPLILYNFWNSLLYSYPQMKFCPVLASENIAPNSVVDLFAPWDLYSAQDYFPAPSQKHWKKVRLISYFLAFLQVSNSCTICCLRRVDFCYMLFYLDNCLQV